MKKAIIIGATSGIGKCLANMLADSGYMVGITGRRTDFLEEMKKAKPESFICKTLDINDTKSSPQYLNELAGELGGLDLLILSSGIGDLNVQMDFEIEKRTIETNVKGFTCIADWTFNYFAKQQFGHFAAITSIGGLRGSRHAPSYYASKAYQINYLEGLRQKVTKIKIPLIITDIRPGLVDTAMAKGEGLFWVAPVDKACKQIILALKRRKIVYITKRWTLIAYIFKLLPDWIYNKI